MEHPHPLFNLQGVAPPMTQNNLETRNPKLETPAILAVIMARAGSVGLPNKSLRPLLGRPVIAYTFDHVRESRLITRTVVISNDPAILKFAHQEGFETLPRPEH